MSNKIIRGDNEVSVSKYFKDIKNSNILTQEEEVQIAKRIQDGDESAIGELVESNLKFVISIAKEYQGQGLTLADLISEGNYGLIKAAKRFDYNRGFRFISYAVYWIKQSIMQSLNDNSRSIRLPANVINKIYKVRKQIEKYENEYGKAPDTGESPLENEDTYPLNSLPNTPTCTSLNQMINEDGSELVDVLIDENSTGEELFNTDSIVLKEELNKTLEILDERERCIIECYWGINTNCKPMTLEAIGEKYGLTKERIRQINEKSIRKLRHNAHNLYEIFKS